MSDVERRIILNQIRTPDGTIIRSMNRHDYVTHLDANGKVYIVDGGNEYLRRNYYEDDPYEELSIYDDAPYEVIRENLHRGGRGIDGKQPLTYVPLCEMSDSWLSACITYNKDLGMSDSMANSYYRKEIRYRKLNKILID
jgi:hypothetical protein